MDGSERTLVPVPPEGLPADAPAAGRRIVPAEPSPPRFVGLAPAGPLDRAVHVESFADFAKVFSEPGRHGGPYVTGGRLAHAVRGFFGNGGDSCVVARAAGAPGTATLADHLAGLQLLVPLDGTSTIAAPDAHLLAGGGDDERRVHAELVKAAELTTGAMALLDAPAGIDACAAAAWRRDVAPHSAAAAVYYPWLRVANPPAGDDALVPPSGHIAGMWARVDRLTGPHRAPTGEPLLGIEGVASELDATGQRMLNRAGINCVRAWPGPETRVWGARSLSDDTANCYLHQRRLVAHIAASIAQSTAWACEQAGSEQAQRAVRASVLTYLSRAWRRGVLHGATPAQAFFVKCYASAEPDPELTIEVGLAVRQPADFHVLRIARRSGD